MRSEIVAKIKNHCDQKTGGYYPPLGFDGECAKKLTTLKSTVVNLDYSYFEDLLECRNFPGMEAEFVAGKLFAIFAQIFTNQYPGHYIKFVTEYLSSYYPENVRVGEIARILGLNPNYLSTLFKSETGKTIRNSLMEIRMNKAMAIINNQHYSVTKTASMVGYSDIYSFSKHFKRYFGHSPKYYLDKSEK